ncbi:MAG: hypothetical protein U9N77_05460 [Thermodesulfobacteriota bacterium]|nr:hypothetical protein [Thermodesulfobacteriota bacterium]
MKKTIKQCIIITSLTLFMITAVNAAAFAQNNKTEPSYEAMAADLLMMRPLGLVSTALGTVLFFVALPFNLHSKELVKRAEKILIKEPSAYTFSRPLGEFK